MKTRYTKIFKRLKRLFPAYPFPKVRFVDMIDVFGLYDAADSCILINKDTFGYTRNDVEATIVHEFAHHVQYYNGYNNKTELQYWLIEELVNNRLDFNEMEAIYFQIPSERQAEFLSWLLTANEYSWKRLCLSGLSLPKRPPTIRNKKDIERASKKYGVEVL